MRYDRDYSDFSAVSFVPRLLSTPGGQPEVPVLALAMTDGEPGAQISESSPVTRID